MTETITRRNGEQTRAAILIAAANAFRENGYDVATLEHIAKELGVTRSAVLHHFGSKAEILHEIVAPFLSELDALFDRAERDGTGSYRRRRAFVTELVDLVCNRRCVAAMLGRDITAQGHLSPSEQISDRATRLVHILGADGCPAKTTRALAALGAVLRPVSAPPGQLDLDDPANRRIIVDCALAALRS